MGYRTKYFIALGMFILGVLLVLGGSGELRGSLGNTALVQSGLWKLVPGVVLLAIGGPAFYYYRSRKKQADNPMSDEIKELLRRAQKK